MPILPEGLHHIQEDLAAGGDPINIPPRRENGIMDSPGLAGSFQQLLADNLGHYVQIDFLVGVQTLVRRSGIIYAVGRSFVVLYDDTNRNFVMCDVFSAKFVAFFATRPEPGVLPNNPMGILQVDAQGNQWPVEDMETASQTTGSTVTPQQLVNAQQQALQATQQFEQQQAAQQQRQPTPVVIPPLQSAAGPGWITLTNEVATTPPNTDRQARGNFY